MDPTFVCIPYLGRLHANLTKGLVEELRYQGDHTLILLYNNADPVQSIQVQPATGILTVEAQRWSLGHMWNDAWETALDLVGRARGRNFNVAFLNNDITISPEFLSRLASRLRLRDRLWAISPNQDQLSGTGLRTEPRGNEHALYGSAFMVKGERFGEVPHLFDEGYHVWYHESDLANKILLSGGYVGIALDVPFRHIDGGSLTTKEAGYDNLAYGIVNPTELDTERFYKEYGEISWPDKVVPIGRGSIR